MIFDLVNAHLLFYSCPQDVKNSMCLTFSHLYFTFSNSQRNVLLYLIIHTYLMYRRICAIWVFPYKLNPWKLEYASRQLGNWCLRAKTQYLASSVKSKACWDLLAFQISINSLWATNNTSLQVPSPGMQKAWLRIIFIKMSSSRCSISYHKMCNICPYLSHSFSLLHLYVPLSQTNT